jgi:hypothetical protein
MITRLPGKLVIGLVVVCSAAAAMLFTTEQWLGGDGPADEPGASIESTTALSVSSTVPVKPVEKLEIDLEAKLVMIPGDGWVSALSFWEIYYSEPQKLPGEMDFELLEEFGAVTASERALAENKVFAQQQTVEVDDPLAIDDPTALQ